MSEAVNDCRFQSLLGMMSVTLGKQGRSIEFQSHGKMGNPCLIGLVLII